MQLLDQSGGRAVVTVLKTDEPTNANTLAAGLVFCLALACDAATALDPPEGVADAAASLRTSSLVLVLCLASPSLFEAHNLSYLNDQRSVLLILLVFTSWAGLHYGGDGTRGADCVYVALATTAVLVVHDKGGIEPEGVAPEGKHGSPNRRRTVASLAAALLCYASLRGVLAAWRSAYEPAEHVLPETGLLGYALYGPWQSLPLAFGHGVGAVAGATVLLSPSAERSGLACLRLEASLCGVLMLACALAVQIGAAEQIDGLPILYGASSCASASEACAEANASRRLSAVIASPASLWLTGLGLLVFGFAFETRPASARCVAVVRRGRPAWVVPLVQEAVLTVVASLGLAAVCIVSFASFEGDALVPEVCLLVSLFAAGVALLDEGLFGWAGSCVYIVVTTYYQTEFVRTYTFDETVVHLTHWTLAFSTACFAAYLLLLLLLFTDCCSSNGSIAARTAGFFVSAGSSAAFMLYLAAAILSATTSGMIPHEFVQSGKGGPTMMSFVVEHYLPLLAWAPAIALRHEGHVLSRAWRIAAWFSPMVVVGCGFALFMGVAGQESPAFAAVEWLSSAACTFLAVAAWSFVGWPPKAKATGKAPPLAAKAESTMANA